MFTMEQTKGLSQQEGEKTLKGNRISQSEGSVQHACSACAHWVEKTVSRRTGQDRQDWQDWMAMEGRRGRRGKRQGTDQRMGGRKGMGERWRNNHPSFDPASPPLSLLSAVAVAAVDIF